jgi:hypothetical protein
LPPGAKAAKNRGLLAYFNHRRFPLLMQWKLALAGAVCIVLLLIFARPGFPAAPASTADIGSFGCTAFSGSFAQANRAAGCLVTETADYIAYVPAGVAADAHLPLLVALSPGADAPSMINELKVTADSLSVVVVASKVSKNGVNITPLLVGYGKLMDESERTLPVDASRVIFAGFSGGGQASYGAAYFYPERVRGVITNCGKLWTNLNGMPKAKLVAFIASPADYNYDAMKGDRAYLQALGWTGYWLEFDGGHSLAPPQAFQNATAWMLSQMAPE